MYGIYRYPYNTGWEAGLATLPRGEKHHRLKNLPQKERETPVGTEREGSAGHGAAVGRAFVSALTIVHIFSQTFLGSELFRDLPL